MVAMESSQYVHWNNLILKLLQTTEVMKEKFVFLLFCSRVTLKATR